MTAVALATIEPGQIRPVVNDLPALPFIRSVARTLDDRFGVKVKYDPDGSLGRKVDRGNLELYGAYDPQRTHASTIFGVVAEKDGEAVGLLQSAVYSLGSYDLAQYTSRFGLYAGSPRIEFRDPAIFLATGITGQAAFNGNLWVRPDQRQSGFSAAWPTESGRIVRAIALATLDVHHTWLFMRANIAKKVSSTAQTRCGGVWWNEEERYIAYSGAEFIRESMRQAAQLPADKRSEYDRTAHLASS